VTVRRPLSNLPQQSSLRFHRRSEYNGTVPTRKISCQAVGRMVWRFRVPVFRDVSDLAANKNEEHPRHLSHAQELEPETTKRSVQKGKQKIPAISHDVSESLQGVNESLQDERHHGPGDRSITSPSILLHRRFASRKSGLSGLAVATDWR
jgi:hypothetical protein